MATIKRQFLAYKKSLKLGELETAPQNQESSSLKFY